MYREAGNKSAVACMHSRFAYGVAFWMRRPVAEVWYTYGFVDEVFIYISRTGCIPRVTLCLRHPHELNNETQATKREIGEREPRILVPITCWSLEGNGYTISKCYGEILALFLSRSLARFNARPTLIHCFSHNQSSSKIAVAFNKIVSSTLACRLASRICGPEC